MKINSKYIQMGKAAKLKKFRKLANQLPLVNYHAVVNGEKKSGYELIKSGVTEVQGSKINPLQHYVQKKVVEKPLNHYRKMKQMYNKHQMAGVAGYANAILHHVQKQKQNDTTVPQ